MNVALNTNHLEADAGRPPYNRIGESWSFGMVWPIGPGITLILGMVWPIGPGITLILGMVWPIGPGITLILGMALPIGMTIKLVQIISFSNN